MKRKGGTFYNFRTNSFVEVHPCYCGGKVWIEFLDQPRKKQQIMNCFPGYPQEVFGWVRIGKFGMFDRAFL
jgi:hypothetical protein